MHFKDRQIQGGLDTAMSYKLHVNSVSHYAYLSSQNRKGELPHWSKVNRYTSSLANWPFVHQNLYHVI